MTLFYNRQGESISEELFMHLRFRDETYWRVAFTRLSDDLEVSTVWLGIDHGFGHYGPLIFETLVFGDDSGEAMWRYRTEDEALEHHQQLITEHMQAKKELEILIQDRPTERHAT